MRYLLFIGIILTSFGNYNCQRKTLDTVKEVDLNKYVGLWYEIAILPNSFEKGCKCTTAEYKINNNGYIKVINKCQKIHSFSKIEGKAFVEKNSGNAKLKVQFFWPFKADYWIIELDKQYQWAAVGNESRKYLWILSREPVLNDSIYGKILEKLHTKGFDTSKMVKTVHDCK